MLFRRSTLATPILTIRGFFIFVSISEAARRFFPGAMPNLLSIVGVRHLLCQRVFTGGSREKNAAAEPHRKELIMGWAAVWHRPLLPPASSATPPPCPSGPRRRRAAPAFPALRSNETWRPRESLSGAASSPRSRPAAAVRHRR